jgi:hypothetical protein
MGALGTFGPGSLSGDRCRSVDAVSADIMLVPAARIASSDHHG